MSETPVPSIYEAWFAKTDKTDAILVVEGKKLHVYKAALSYYSGYFKKLFHSNFIGKSMPEIEIKDVTITDFAVLYSVMTLQEHWLNLGNVERQLELSDRFSIPSVKYVFECFLISSDMDVLEKLRIADKYKLDMAVDSALLNFISHLQFKRIKKTSQFKGFSESTKLKILDRLMLVIDL